MYACARACVCVCNCEVCHDQWDVSLFCSVPMDDANGVTCVSKEKQKMAKALSMCLYFYPVL